MTIIEIFKKQGGYKLIKEYFSAGVLFTALNQFVVLGHSRTALEILRLSTQIKIKQKLKKKYYYVLKKFNKTYDYSIPNTVSNKVWICWLQGMENAPFLVQKCYESIKKNLKDREIVLITSNNFKDYVSLPNYILEKWSSGVITNTHFTDLLRIELLIKYGGMWIDATVYCSCSRDYIPDYFFDSDLFLYQSLKPGRDGHSHIISSWLISAKTNNKILLATRALCYEYWKINNRMIDYFLLHDFISIVSDFYSEDWLNIVPRDNSTPHILLLRLFDKYDEKIWKAVTEQTPFHKLSYKFLSQQDCQQEGTFYKKIIE